MEKITNLIRKNVLRDVELEMFKRVEDGLLISREIMTEILRDLEDVYQKELDEKITEKEIEKAVENDNGDDYDNLNNR